MLICTLSSGAYTQIYAQTRDEQISKGVDYVYQLKNDSATAIFQSFIDKDPKDPTGYFFLSVVEWWKIYLNKEDRSNDDNYLSKTDKCIKVCEERLDENEYDDWTTLLLGGAKGLRGFMNFMRDNVLSAIDDGRDGLNLVQKSYEMNPSNKDAALGIGIYNYAVDYVVERYSFLKAVLFFFPKGNKELGLQQLKECSANGKFSRVMADVVLAFINLSYEKNYIEAERYSVNLVSQYPQNPVFEKFLGKCYIGLNKWQPSEQLYRNMISKADSNKIAYNNNFTRREANYYLALSLSRLNQLDSAIKYYNTVLGICEQLEKPGEESPYYVFAALGLGVIYDQKGNRGEAVKYYDRVLAMKDIENSRETAQKFKDSAPR